LQQGVKQLNNQEISPGVKNRLSETLGDVYLNLGLFDQSESMYQVYQPGITDDNDDHRVLIKKAELSYQQGELDRVKTLLNDIDSSTAATLVVFAINKLQVMLQIQTGDFNQSELMAQHLLSWTLEEFDEGSKPHVEALMTLAHSKGLDVSKHEEILKVYLQAKNKTANQPQHQVIDLEITAKIAALYKDLNQYELAEKFALEYSKQTAKIYGDESLSYAKSIGILANIYYRLNQPHEALPLRLRAIEIRGKYFGEYDPKMAASYYNTAIIYAERLQDYEKALPYYEKAFTCLKGATGSSLISLNFMKINHSMTLIELGHYEQAEQQLIELLAFYRPYKLKAQRNETWINLLFAQLYDKTGKDHLVADHMSFVTPRLDLFSPNSVYRSIYHGLVTKYPHLVESDSN
jgi:tetratricopeptide (TPR) repeat protein